MSFDRHLEHCFQQVLMTGLSSQAHGPSPIGMLRGQRKRADISDRPGRQTNRNSTWPAEKGGHQSCGSRGMAVLDARFGSKIPFEVATCSTVSQRLAVLILAIKVFAECSSLASEGVANQFCSSTKFGHYLFRDCINLATFVLQETNHQQEPQARIEARELSQGCLSSAGTVTLELTRDFHVLGAHAFFARVEALCVPRGTSHQ